MQTNLFTKEQINQESSIGEFYKGHTDHDPLKKLYFSYPGVEEIYKSALKALSENKKLTFVIKNPVKNNNLYNNNFLKDGFQSNKNIFDGLMTTHFGSLLTPNLAGQKVLGNYSLAFIEAQASKIYHDYFHKNAAIDHFYNAQGVANSNLLTEIVKAFEIKKNEVISFLIPANSIRAFKENKYSTWNALEQQTNIYQKKSIYLLDKNSGKTKAKIDLVSEEIKNLGSPIYKIKIDDRWAFIMPWQLTLDKIKENMSFSLDNNLIKFLKTNKRSEETNENQQEFKIEASVGQATRVIFELLDGDYENVPEAILNFEGGSWSSIALENSSSGRHQGINSMHEVLYNKWYEHQDIAIPWNYLGFDILDKQDRNFIEDPNVFLLSFENNDKALNEKNCFIEANQSWKKLINEVTKYVVKFIYREYSAIASKKYLLSTKEIMQMSAKFIANWSIHGFNNKSDAYQKQLEEENFPKELIELLECVTYAHMILAAQNDFHACKTHKSSISRLKCIAQLIKKLEKLCPISVKNLKQKISNTLQKDIKSENTTLWQLFKKELV
jgi:hypothetical protein